MPINRETRIFGTALRTRVLAALALAGESFPTELARLLGARVFPVQRVIDALELEGLVASRKLGVERRVTLDPRFFAHAEMRALLVKLGERDTPLWEALSERRARPRRRGKPL